MSTSLSGRCLALAIPGLLLASLSTARADTITYNIVDYPASETDLINPGTDSVSGTITTDGTIGPLDFSHIVGGSLTFASPNATSTEPLNLALSSGNFVASPTQLLVTPGDSSSLVAGINPNPVYPDFTVLFSNNAPSTYFDGILYGTHLFALPDAEFLDPPQQPDTGSIGENNPWIIAQTVPEPASITLLGSALLGLRLVHLRRRRVKA